MCICVHYAHKPGEGYCRLKANLLPSPCRDRPDIGTVLGGGGLFVGKDGMAVRLYVCVYHVCV